jgi:mRNA-degrading endonuclease RelE of RelBE toxin-antitoxin system
LVYRVLWLPATEEELKRFSTRFQRTIIRKVEHIAQNLPSSLRLKGVQRIRGQETLQISARLFELDVGSGPRVAFALYDNRELLTVYLVGTHDYAKVNYLRAATERLEE